MQCTKRKLLPKNDFKTKPNALNPIKQLFTIEQRKNKSYSTTKITFRMYAQHFGALLLRNLDDEFRICVMACFN
jgi:hypothetical protein